ncbi:hypothetical protein [Aeromicrobium sp. UC242_57]|uniref:hypothetical protein n=1 Tax=Aeromicrobium sp. UC242_57 TaxID=3374624 RepID=UPI0037A9560B
MLVSEYRRSTGFRVVKYSGSAFPRSFLAFKTSNGSPAGAATAMTSSKARSVTVSGYVSAPGTTRVALRVKIVRAGRTLILPVKRKAAGFYFRSTVSAQSMPRGKAKVTVLASAGKKTRTLGSRSVTIR